MSNVRVITLGTFDLMHVGHVSLFQACRALGNVKHLTVAINSDDFVKRYKGAAPIQNIGERLLMVSACRYVDATQVNYGGEHQSRCIIDSKADIIAIGDDWKDRDYLGQLGITTRWLIEHQVEVVYIPRFEGFSSTELKQRIKVA